MLSNDSELKPVFNPADLASTPKLNYPARLSRLASIKDKIINEFIPKKQWDIVAMASHDCINLAPDESFGWFYVAYAQHQLKRTEDAVKTLEYAIINQIDGNLCETRF